MALSVASPASETFFLAAAASCSACSALAFEAKADANAAESKATVVADCARAYFSAFGTLFEGDDVQKQAAQVREQLAGITEQCQAALG